MDKKYWVPALEKSNLVLQAISEQPSSLKLIDLSKRLGINKSSMFSLLATMEALDWVVREEDATYSLGSKLGYIGNAFFKQFSLIDRFRKEASVTKHVIKETIQLAKLERNEVLYLAKEEMPSPVRLSSEPGIKYPAHATALGKAMLAWVAEPELGALYASETLDPCLTPHTLQQRSDLIRQLEDERLRVRLAGSGHGLLLCGCSGSFRQREGRRGDQLLHVPARMGGEAGAGPA
ncbi:transcriptional regulator, IclR family [Paenibacillus tianmuensis]|uniref:Transcriptional regulator, IclR family n=1 Tax=Paenibacillus tianmuensis TaxID=624147 RepID=A0A1G4RB79_9BACL|nr:transcriptional regulator, IclR family [Paenibacillus tianmuensis]